MYIFSDRYVALHRRRKVWNDTCAEISRASESLRFVHTDRFPNGSGSDRSSVHTETAIRTVYPVQ